MTAATKASLKDRLVLLGICSDENSSYMRGAAEAPALIRSALYGKSANLTSETGISLSNTPRFIDRGDIIIGNDIQPFMDIERQVSEIINDGALPLVLGGDHAITYPILRAVSRQYGKISILHFDAHPDLYDELDGNRLSHACPFARIMEEGLAKRLVQVGIRTTNAHQKAQAERFGVEIHEMRFFDPRSFDPVFTEPVYLSFDMDALDPAYAPGVSHFEPGGLSVRDVISIIHKVQAPIIGADIVEYNPKHDVHNLTAMVAAKLVKEIGGMILKNTP
ncbi:MAG: agmatinase [Desulfobacterales bacterium]